MDASSPSLSLTVTRSTRDGMIGYTVRIVSGPLLTTPIWRVDDKILRALDPDLSPAICYTSADITFFVPVRYITDPAAFAAHLTANLAAIPTSVPAPVPVVPVLPEAVPEAPVPKWRSGMAGVSPAGASAAYNPPQIAPVEEEDDDGSDVELDPSRCLCITQAGTQCSRRPAKGKSVCAQHGRKK
jgi:hypothetical protein